MKKKRTSSKERALCTGRCAANRRGMRFVRPTEGNGEELRLNEGSETVFSGDIVRYRVVRRKGRLEAELAEIVARAHPTFLASLRRAERRWYLQPADLGLGEAVRLKDKPDDLAEGTLVLARVIRWPSRDVEMLARVETVLGDETQTAVMLAGIAAEHGFPPSFPPEVNQQVLPETDEENRRDLRDLPLFTIDGDDAQDFDDAVSLVRRDGRLQLGIHIADVSFYVREGSPIDREAYARGTSLYLPRYTIPMLPERLCNDLCSLRPDGDRRAMSLLVDMDTGASELTSSLIRSRARLTYGQVNALFAGQENTVPDSLHDTLRDMLALSRKLRAQRSAKGCVDFDLPEIEFGFDDRGDPVSFRTRDRGEAERMIEDFMLLANEHVARMAKEAKLPFAYRVHESPDADKLHTLSSLLDALNIKTKVGTNPPPAKLQRLLAEAEEKGCLAAVAPAMLRCMQRARYDARPLGHYALALGDYCHFTSPIRRYPDLLVHRALKKMLACQPPLGGDMDELCRQCSQREYEATLAEREGDDLCACLALRGHEGERFTAQVSGVSRGAFFVRLPGGAEGCVPYRLLRQIAESDESFTRVLLGRGKVLCLGDPIDVVLTRVNVPERELTFLPAEQSQNESPGRL